MDTRVKLEIGPDTPGDRVRSWMRMLDENFMGVECSDAGDDLRASVTNRVLDRGSIAQVRFTRQTLARSPRLAANADEDLVLIAVVKEGRHVVRQGGRESVLRGQGLYILDDSRPFEVGFASDTIAQCTCLVPKASLTRRVGPLDDLAFGPEVPLQKLVATFVCGVVESLDEVDAETANGLLDQALDLIGLMIAERNRGRIDPSTHRAGTLLRVKAYVRAHLAEEDLTIEQTARALGISSRYVNALLATEGVSFGRYLRGERLEGARREILDPRRVHRQVTEVAFDWGFKNASHFARAFKVRYGMSPRDAKHRAC